MKTQSFKILVWVLTMLFGSLALLTSCDKIKEDALPEPVQASKSTIKVRQKLPVVVDLFKRHNLTNASTFTLKNTPTYGTAKFLSNGMLMYSPNASAVSVTDIVTYEACTNGSCQNYNLEMQINSPNTPVDTTASCVNLFADTLTLNVVLGTINAVTIPMLNNDVICQGVTLSPNTIQIAVQPLRGTAQVTSNKNIIYTYSPNSTSTVNPDVIIYSVTYNSQVYYGAILVYLNIQNPSCPLVVNNDLDSLNVNTTKLLKIFDNDSFCQNLLGNPAFQIVTPPANGTLGNSTNNYTGINYTPNTNYMGQDNFVYKLNYANGTSQTGTVNIKVKSTSTPCGIPLDAKNDSYVFPLTQMPNLQAILPVLSNDDYCPQVSAPYGLSIQQEPAQGTGTVITVVTDSGGNIIYTLPNSTFTGTVTFTYQLCRFGVCDTATVTLTITP